MESDPPLRSPAPRCDTGSDRIADLRRMLIERRRAMQEVVHRRIYDGRIERPTHVRDELEQSDQDHCGSTAAQFKARANTVSRVDEALWQLDAGKYGRCVDCKGEIPERQLHALPFAMRCQDCELKHQQERAHLRHADLRRGNLLPFPARRNPERV